MSILSGCSTPAVALGMLESLGRRMSYSSWQACHGACRFLALVGDHLPNQPHPLACTPSRPPSLLHQGRYSCPAHITCWISDWPEELGRLLNETAPSNPGPRQVVRPARRLLSSCHSVYTSGIPSLGRIAPLRSCTESPDSTVC